MSFKYENEVDMNLFVSILKDAVSKVKTEEDPEILTDLKKVFKKNVPFSLRMYVAAYLAKQSMHGRSGSYRGRRDNRDSRFSSRDWKNRDTRNTYNTKSSYTPSAEITAEKEAEPRAPRVEIDPSLAATIFIGIGRNRRVYPRDLVGLLVSVAQLDRDRIGDIRVLANYSFIQLFKEDADKVIAALNGYDYRGRKLTVSYSRQKGAEDSADFSDSSSEYSEETNFSAEDAAAYAAAEKAASDKEPFGSNV